MSTDATEMAIDSEARRIEREAGCAAVAHRMATSAWRGVYMALGVPTTALAAVAGASALADYKVLAAVLALLATVASALMNFLNPAAQVAEHGRATGRFRAIENRARVFWEITCASDVPVERLRHDLAQLIDDWSKVIEASPPLFERFHRRGRLRYEASVRQEPLNESAPTGRAGTTAPA